MEHFTATWLIYGLIIIVIFGVGFWFMGKSRSGAKPPKDPGSKEGHRAGRDD
ncbi:hypothetical protein [Knoellia koreensis]|uniref:Uncharacterized protein n=1 Tax=Knoellia koreensis TaxID=2730921 RepID=A0A849HKD6_9MICO|nr:hypothetical protein [Knoellia sp. DB2414S]NNM47004.1 hypothetical protein [Knoellia sp. DB2414S]